MDGGRTAVRGLFGGLLTWRVGVRWYLVALLLPATFCLSAAALHVLLVLLFVGQMTEEIGWRWYALPMLQAERSALLASLILGSSGFVAPAACLDRGDELARPPIPPLRAHDRRSDDTVYLSLQRHGGKPVDRRAFPRRDQLHPDPGARTTDEHDAPQDLYDRRRIALGVAIVVVIAEGPARLTRKLYP